MLLKKLIKNLSPKTGALKITGISQDSRKVKKGNLFVALKGEKYDGKKYISQAISKGARAVIYSGKIKKNKKTKFINFKDTRSILARLSASFYKNKPKNIIAVPERTVKLPYLIFFIKFLSYKISNLVL